MNCCYSIVLLFAAVSLAAAINPNTVLTRTDRRRLHATMAGVNHRGGPRSFTDKDLAAETRLTWGTTSHVHGGDQSNGGPEGRSVTVADIASVSFSKEIADEEAAVRAPSAVPLADHVRVASPVSSVTDVPPAPMVSSQRRIFVRKNRSRKTSTTSRAVSAAGTAAKGIVRYVTFTVLGDRQTQPDSIEATSSAPYIATARRTDCLGTTRGSPDCEDSDQGAMFDMPVEENEDTFVAADEPPELCDGDDVKENNPDEYKTLKINRSTLLIIIMILFTLTVCKIIMGKMSSRKCRSTAENVCLRLDKCKCYARFSPCSFHSFP